MDFIPDFGAYEQHASLDNETRVCSACQQTLPLGRFKSDKECVGGHRPACRECVSKGARHKSSERLPFECPHCHKQYSYRRAVPTGACCPDEGGRPWNDDRNLAKVRLDGHGIAINPFRVGVLDIECTALDASFGRVLSASILSFDPEVMMSFRADDYQKFRDGQRSDDSELVADILDYLEDFDIIIAYNGLTYDYPFLRTRALIAGLPPVEPKKLVDPLFMIRKVFRFHRNSLDAISTMLDTDFRKTPLEPRLWIKAYGDGDSSALDQIVEHCEKDVRVLAEIAHKTRKYIKQLDSWGSFTGR